MAGAPWGERAKVILKAQLVDADVGYEELSRRLKGIGTVESAAVINRKINRGTFAAEFFLQCLAVLKVDVLRLEEEGSALVAPPVPVMGSIVDGLSFKPTMKLQRKGKR